MKQFKKILIIKPSSLGDIVHSLPVLDVLRRCYPQADIQWLVAHGFEGVLEGHPLLDRIWVIRKEEWKKITKISATFRELRTLFRALRAEGFDCVIDLQGLFRSGVIAQATQAAVRIGFREAREGSSVFYTHRIEGGRNVHAVDRYLKIPAFLGCSIGEVTFPFPEATPQHEFLRDDKYAVMAPGARQPIKRWPAERFGKLASLLPVKTMVVGSRSDRALAQTVVETSRGNALSLAGKTDLKTLIGIIRNAEFMVCNDTGPMHIAAALGVYVVALFGPSDPLKTGPYGMNHTIIRKEMHCSPCRKRNCSTRSCINEITVEEVAHGISDFMTKSGWKPLRKGQDKL